MCIEHIVLSDARKIIDYIGYDGYEIPKIIIDPNSSQGLNLSDHVILGVKGGYVERLLIHELIHWFLKIRHTYPSDFFAATYPDDELSTFIEKRLFG